MHMVIILTEVDHVTWSFIHRVYLLYTFVVQVNLSMINDER